MAAVGITIRPLKGPEEYHRAERVQRQAWNMQEIEIAPSHLLITVEKNGGLVLGAFDEEQMVGMLLGFLGQDESGRYKHCSHMMGVIPSHRGKGIGTALKKSQREFALKQGLELVTWTYDPLESINATLNIARLGATSGTYLRNVYGQMRDGLNQGLASDRLQVDWWIRSRRVSASMDRTRFQPSLGSLQGAGATVINKTNMSEPGLLEPDSWSAEDASAILLEIPADFQRIKSTDMSRAHAWRQMTREIFERYFQEGYQVTEFLREKEANRKRCFYLLKKSADMYVSG